LIGVSGVLAASPAGNDAFSLHQNCGRGGSRVS
jgi:hypothetical protein